jgi:acetylornithine deacetylase/succinyl-diaminopimelate desuccinylase-like protein
MKKLMIMLLAAAATAANAQEEKPYGRLRPDQTAYLALYKELVEINTTPTTGSCTEAAARIAGHLKVAGFPVSDVAQFADTAHPKDGGVTAILHGTDKTLKPILLLGHLDVVEAKRADWTRDPFKLVEEKNYFFARGAGDMKAMSTAWFDMLMRFKKAGYHPQRSIKMALTCGEETTYAFNGAAWLAKNRPDLVAAEFALNEGGGGETDGHGDLQFQTMNVGEKASQNYRIEATNPGGHSSIPIRDNAIYELADALVKVRNYEFPVKFTDTTKLYFAMAGARRHDDVGAAMVALSKNPDDAAAAASASKDRTNHSLLRTTCVATLLDGGHANNALPQRAGANINCRIFPGETVEGTRAALAKVIGYPKVTITPVPPIRPLAQPPKLDPKVMGPAEALVKKYYPGVPLVPSMSTGASDGIFLEAIGIPTYGVPGDWSDPDGNGVHGLNEREGVRAAFIGRDFWTDLVKAYADEK